MKERSPLCCDPDKACPNCNGFGVLLSMPLTPHEMACLPDSADVDKLVQERACSPCLGTGYRDPLAVPRATL